MRILVTADLHYDITRSKEPARELAAQVCRTPADALVLVGDTAGSDPAPLIECLGLFADFPGRKLLVPGNHCLWCRPGEDSMDRYNRLLPQWAAQAGFSVLDHHPEILSGPSAKVDDAGQSTAIKVGLVGSVGWYDYTFRNESLGIPEEFYRAKVAPGAAAYLQEHRHLIDAHGHRLEERHYAMGSRWMDGVNVRLGMSDHQFVELLAAKLRTQVNELADQVDRIVAFVHHLPFRELIPPDRPDRFAFAAAYMGSGLLGEVLLACDKVTDVYCGHSHWRDDRKIGRVQVVNIGSTYVEKRLSVLDL